jgi:hypothetical protein
LSGKLWSVRRRTAFAAPFRELISLRCWHYFFSASVAPEGVDEFAFAVSKEKALRIAKAAIEHENIALIISLF